MHTGTGAGLTSRSLGAKGGIEKKKLTVDNMPAHNHDVAVTAGPPDSFDPAGGLSCKGTSTAFDSSGSPSGTMKASAISSAGGGKAVNNMQPFAVVQYIIALQGVYPSRS